MLRWNGRKTSNGNEYKTFLFCYVSRQTNRVIVMGFFLGFSAYVTFIMFHLLKYRIIILIFFSLHPIFILVFRDSFFCYLRSSLQVITFMPFFCLIIFHETKKRKQAKLTDIKITQMYWRYSSFMNKFEIQEIPKIKFQVIEMEKNSSTFTEWKAERYFIYSGNKIL